MRPRPGGAKRGVPPREATEEGAPDGKGAARGPGKNGASRGAGGSRTGPKRAPGEKRNPALPKHHPGPRRSHPPRRSGPPWGQAGPACFWGAASPDAPARGPREGPKNADKPEVAKNFLKWPPPTGPRSPRRQLGISGLAPKGLESSRGDAGPPIFPGGAGVPPGIGPEVRGADIATPGLAPGAFSPTRREGNRGRRRTPRPDPDGRARLPPFFSFFFFFFSKALGFFDSQLNQNQNEEIFGILSWPGYGEGDRRAFVSALIRAGPFVPGARQAREIFVFKFYLGGGIDEMTRPGPFFSLNKGAVRSVLGAVGATEIRQIAAGKGDPGRGTQGFFPFPGVYHARRPLGPPILALPPPGED